MNAARILVAAIAVAGCSSTGPNTVQLLGNFAAPLGDRTSYLAVRMFMDADGNLSGRGWSSYSSTLAAGVTITGTKAGESVSLLMHPKAPLGLVDWRLDGTLTGDTLRGAFFFERNSAQPVELLRVSTIPLGDYSLSMAGALTDSSIGLATFNYGGGSFRLVQFLNVPDRSLLVIRWYRRDLPAPGTYLLAPDGTLGPTAEFTYNPGGGSDDEDYPVQGGRIVVQESARYVLAGRFDLNATDPRGRAVRLTGTFNAGCTGNAC